MRYILSLAQIRPQALSFGDQNSLFFLFNILLLLRRRKTSSIPQGILRYKGVSTVQNQRKHRCKRPEEKSLGLKAQST